MNSTDRNWIDTGYGYRVLIGNPRTVLAQFNAERSRGILHTPEWREAMAVFQAEFDAQREQS